ncbi:hypothetical protein EG328_009939 [Venturia inaequalis]|uniref:Uncharacterized protein n=1 Tax=Venturia inaequalis TaxID=5025 RepID=A0A8H3V5C0_VENIN|nr:hypothetical protein EG328_009939 [Venturia inaequalis]
MTTPIQAAPMSKIKYDSFIICRNSLDLLAAHSSTTSLTIAYRSSLFRAFFASASFHPPPSSITTSDSVIDPAVG